MSDITHTRRVQRIQALGNLKFIAPATLAEAFEQILGDREAAQNLGADTRGVDMVVDRLLTACERGSEVQWGKPSRVAAIADTTAETVRAWCRAGKVRYRGGDGEPYLVHIPSAMEQAAKMRGAA